ncbi:unnamed protein product [Caenorhabditis angaria]|uniref:Uncharacterized protein n=1 Tax=Caenorhabditis angaria TaxID=860376 RepID=A0A9P1N473_9PELO|nr:unnamed protein product [Caenorhabditis angaria]
MKTIANCQAVFPKVTWCAFIFHLEENFELSITSKWKSYNELGISDFKCFKGPDEIEHFTIDSKRSRKGLFPSNFKIVVGIRHNCTGDGTIREVIAGVKHVSEYESFSEIRTKFDIYHTG